MPEVDIFIGLTCAWLLYFFIHSLLASIIVKRWVERHFINLMPWYRLIFNLLAILLLILPLYLLNQEKGDLIVHWTGIAAWFQQAALLLVILGFFWSLKFYDGKEFLGIRQIKNHILQLEDQEQFRISPLHRYVRHPWYFMALVLIWTRDMNSAFLLSAILLTIYFYIGSRLEEKKLIQYHGDKYRQYRKSVPGLLPSPWKILSKQQAKSLLNNSH